MNCSEQTAASVLQAAVRPLLEWYTQNSRTLPWRENTDPYRVWISEIMLQQTRVDTVIPYYIRFIRRLPDIRSLAEIPEEELLKLWEGLGYYSRAKNLQKAAKKICADFGGVFPGKYEDIRALPGIGMYTAGAIASIAFELPYAAVDGNVLRVLARILEDGRSMADMAVREEFSHTLEAVYPMQRRGDFTQSLMELGAVVCLPNGAPRCDICPVQFLCHAFCHKTQLAYPKKEEKPERKKQEKTVLLMHFQNKTAIHKREHGELLAGLWEFPNMEGKRTSDEICKWLEDMGVTTEDIHFLAVRKHIFTHIEWRMHTYLLRCKEEKGPFVWVTKEQLEEEITLPTAFKKLLSLLDQQG